MDNIIVHPQIDLYKNCSLTLDDCNCGWSVIVYFCINNAVSFLEYSFEIFDELELVSRFVYPSDNCSGYKILFYKHLATNKLYVRWDWYDASCNSSSPPSAHAFFEIPKDVYTAFVDDLDRVCRLAHAALKQI